MFRLKIALLSVLLSGIVLIGLGWYSLTIMNKVGMDRIDREILSLGEGHLSAAPPREYWQNFERSLKTIYGEDRAQSTVVLIKDPGNEVLYRSPHWPAEISEDAFPGFDRTMDTRPREDDVRERRGGPPIEAYQACEGRSAGSRSQFTGPGGESLAGSCEQDGPGRLVLRPDRNRRDRQGQDEARRDRLPADRRQQDHPDRLLPRIKPPHFATVETASGAFRAGIMGSERVTMLVGMDLAAHSEDVRRYRRALQAAIPVALLLLAGGGWLIAQRALRPVALITRTAGAITARDLGRRVPPVDADRELTRLVDVINGMLERLEKSFGQAVRFSADAAHELQTPLTILQGELDDAVQHARDGSDEQRRASSLLEEVQRLKAIVQKLLVLARADAGRLELRLEPVDLSALIGSAAEDAGVLGPELSIEKDITPGVVVQADPDLLAQAVGNLVSNAVKYNRERGIIRFCLAVRNGRALFTLSNTGTPIPPAARERIFDRFYRVDASRSKAVAGSGLGLSLAREIVHAHRGELSLDPPTGDLVSFTVSLPCSTS